MLLFILLASEAFWNNLPQILVSLGVFFGSIVTGLLSWLAFKRAGEAKKEATDANVVGQENKAQLKENKIQLEDIGHKTDGQLKELMDLMREKYIEEGARTERAKRDKQDSDENVGELRHLKKQVPHPPPPDISRNREDKIIDAVENKGDEIKDEVDEIPKKVVDEVKKIPPPKSK